MHESIFRHAFRGLYALAFVIHAALLLWANSVDVVWIAPYVDLTARPLWALAGGGLFGLLVLVVGWHLAGAVGSTLGWRVDVELGTCRLVGYTRWGQPSGRWSGGDGGLVKRDPPTLWGLLASWTTERREPAGAARVPTGPLPDLGRRDNGDPARRSPPKC